MKSSPESPNDSPEEAPAKALTKAVDLLALRPHFGAELALKLERRGFDDSTVEATLARLLELGYLDDLKAARGFAGQRVARRGWGPRRLTAELSRRGVDEDHVRTVVGEAFAAGEGTLAREVATRWAAKARATKGPAGKDPAGKSRADRDRLARYLDRRGFSMSVIVEILGEFAAEQQERQERP